MRTAWGAAGNVTAFPLLQVGQLGVQEGRLAKAAALTGGRGRHTHMPKQPSSCLHHVPKFGPRPFLCSHGCREVPGVTDSQVPGA